MTRAHAHLLATAAELSDALHDAIERAGPLRLAKPWTDCLGTALCRSVAGQQLSVAAARTIWGRVLESAGERELLEHLARARPETLRRRGLSATKARAMRSIARARAEGLLEVDELARLDTEARASRLVALHGVGPWTADMMNLFFFRDPDVWPDGDVTARRTLARLTSKRRKTVRTAARFAPYRSYLALHMYRHADAAPDGTETAAGADS